LLKGSTTTGATVDRQQNSQHMEGSCSEMPSGMLSTVLLPTTAILPPQFGPREWAEEAYLSAPSLLTSDAATAVEERASGVYAPFVPTSLSQVCMHRLSIASNTNMIGGISSRSHVLFH
jgi:hypothetical protein